MGGIKTVKYSGLGNYYGEVVIGKDDDGKYYMGLENYDGMYWVPVSEEFFLAFEKEFG